MKELVHRSVAGVKRHFRRVAIFVAGASVLLAGVALLVLPGPGIALILIGLAILATEFAWARSLLQRAKGHASSAGNKVGSFWQAKGHKPGV